MDGGFAFVAHAQAAELAQPGEGPLDDPAGLAKAAAVLAAPPGDECPDAFVAQAPLGGAALVGAVGLHEPGPVPWPPAPAFEGRDGIDERLKLCDIMGIGRRHNHGQRDAACINGQVMLAAGLSPVGGIGAAFFPPPPPSEGSRSRARRATSRSFPRRGAAQGAPGGGAPTRPPSATHEGAASTSCPSRSPSQGGGPPRRCPS